MDVPDTVSIRADLEATRAAYHELLASLSDADWHRRSGNPSLTVKQLMWHMAWSMTFMAGAVDGVLRSRSFNPPSFLVEPARLLAMRWLARRATPEAAARKYDDGHAALLARLDALRGADWSRSVQRFGEQRDAAWYFRHPEEHFAEHARDVRAGI